MLKSPNQVSDLATTCIRCGFCLESCPTFALTGQETESPRGRINLIRSADEGKIAWESVRPHLDRCLGCRACETACPSGVEYGSLLELARERLKPPPGHRALLFLLTRPKLLRLSMRLSQGKPPRAVLKLLLGSAPEVRARRSRSVPQGRPISEPPPVGEVALLEGCAMRALFPEVHWATRKLLRRVGYVVARVDLGCCGALEGHAGLSAPARTKADRVLRAAGDRPIIVNSAGCGAWLKAQAGGAAIYDLSEFLLEHGLAELLSLASFPKRVTYHDACHLAHGQGIRTAPRRLLKAIPDLELVELRDADRCCGSAGIYNLTQPDIARKLRDEKWGHIEATRAEVVIQGNPGCHAWLEQAAEDAQSSVRVLHLAELLDAAF